MITRGLQDTLIESLNYSPAVAILGPRQSGKTTLALTLGNQIPKVYVRDSGLVHSLLNIPSFNDLLSHPVLGRSWEGFVIENILSTLDTKALPYYYRTSAGAEIDLILEFSGQEKWAIEIKHASTPVLSKGFHLACEDIKADRKWVIYSGDDRFPMPNGVTAISLRAFMQALRDK